ncbi:MAG: hypothetical protein LPJ98_07250, partial [Cyclobacteriaceae bacterium]|nr:hypothetical protein [Cyclobacteriaceae bacterium]
MMYRSLYKIFPSTAFVFVLLLACQNSRNEYSEAPLISGPTLFELITPEESGVIFNNKLTEGPNTNVLMYEYFYNGG